MSTWSAVYQLAGGIKARITKPTMRDTMANTPGFPEVHHCWEVRWGNVSWTVYGWSTACRAALEMPKRYPNGTMRGVAW